MSVSENSVGASVLSPSKHPLKLPVKGMTIDARGSTGQTNLCMGMPGLDKGILFHNNAL
jgi:hypothetical protein